MAGARTYRYIFRWTQAPKEISIVGANVSDVYRQAAKLWCPTMAKQDIDDVVRWFKEAGGRVVRLPREIHA